MRLSPDGAASRAYYAAFYAVSAVFAAEGKTFTRHSAVEAASADFCPLPTKHPRIHLLTIEELLGGKGIDYPGGTSITFKKAPRVKGKKPQSGSMF